MDPLSTPEELAKTQAYWRHFCDRIWLVLLSILAGGGTIGWIFTGNRDHLYGGIFFALVPILGLFYIRFFLFNLWSDPLTTQARLQNFERKQMANAQTIARCDGWMLVISSPIILIIAAGKGAEEYGGLGFSAGIIAGLCWLVSGMLAIAWSRRSWPFC